MKKFVCTFVIMCYCFRLCGSGGGQGSGASAAVGAAGPLVSIQLPPFTCFSLIPISRSVASFHFAVTQKRMLSNAVGLG